MRLGNILFGLVITLCLVAASPGARAQTGNAAPTPPPVNPLTGPSFPCPQPEDPLAQLVCSTPSLALLDMQFVQAYEALYQQAGASGQSSVRHLDLQFDMGVRTTCGIGLSQASNPSPTPPPPAPSGASACVIPLYQQQITLWKGMLNGAALEEANRPIQDQVALQTRLQAMGFLPAQAQMDGVFGTGTRAAIKQWQTGVGRLPTGLLGDADAQALLGSTASSGSNGSSVAAQVSSEPTMGTDTPAQSSAPASPTNAQNASPTVIPLSFQGVWSVNCTAAENNTVGYWVTGPSQILIYSPDSGANIVAAVQFIQGPNGFALTVDNAATGSAPSIRIDVMQVVSANQISLFSSFDNSDGISPGVNTIQNKCSENSAFSNAEAQVSNYVAPSPAELAASQTALSEMPSTMGTKWRP